MKKIATKIILSISLFICSCENKNELRIYNWTDYIGQNTISEFERLYDVDVIYDNYTSNEELLAKLATSKGEYDVIFPSGYTVEILRENDNIEPIDKDKIPNFVNIPKRFSNPTIDPNLNYSIPYTWSTTGIGYNSEEVLITPDSSWNMLFDKQYSGEILMLDDARACLGMALKYLGFSANSTSVSEITEAYELLEKQKPLVHIFSSDNLPQLFSSEEIKLGYAWSGDIRQASAINPNIRFMTPKEGSLIYVDYVCIAKGSKNRDMAHNFINFILDGKASLDIAKTTSYATTNSKAYELASESEREIWGNFQQMEVNNYEEIRNLGELNSQFEEKWIDLKMR